MVDDLVSIDAEKPRSEIAATLRSIADQFDDGDTLEIVADDQSASVVLSDPLSFELELEIERESDDETEIELEIEIEWTEPGTFEDAVLNEGEAQKTGGRRDETESVSDDDLETTESLGEFQLFEDRAGEWRWRLVHRNGNTIASSGEGYTTKQNARKGIRSVVRNAPGASITEITGSK